MEIEDENAVAALNEEENEVNGRQDDEGHDFCTKLWNSKWFNTFLGAAGYWILGFVLFLVIRCQGPFIHKTIPLEYQTRYYYRAIIVLL